MPNRPAKKIVLALLPYWTPLIPPLGITCLKSHLELEGFDVATADANMENVFRELYHQYFEIVKSNVPPNKRGNFFNIGMEFMRNHMMAHLNATDRGAYADLIGIVFYQSYYCEISREGIDRLTAIVEDLYEKLTSYVMSLMKKHNPDVLGLSTFSGTLPASLHAFKVVKENFPHVTTVMGGGTFSMELAINNPNFNRLLERADYIDKFIVGEGETLFLKFLKGELPADKRVYTLQDVAKAESVEVNHSILPDFSDLDVSLYPQLGSWTSRSCPYQCSFCSETIHWGVYRKKTPAKIVQELKELHLRHKVNLFLFGDSLLNIVIEGLAGEVIQQNLPLYWDGYLRTDPPVCKIENVKKWRSGGLYRARLGVESGSQRVLDIMNKKISVENIRASIKALASVGVKTTTYWIVGHPGETEEDFQATLNLIEELKDDIWEAEVNPFAYFLTGQVDSDKWMSEYPRITLYPEKYTDMLLTQTWVLERCHPTREVAYERAVRFVNHCTALGIPNPYFEHEIYRADIRWKKLHDNAVPSLIDFKDQAVPVDIFRRGDFNSLSVEDLENLLEV